jgi:hypothetical protein
VGALWCCPSKDTIYHMRRSQSSLSMSTKQPVRLVKSRSEAVIHHGGKVVPQPLSPLNSDDEDEEDEVNDDDGHYEVYLIPACFSF